MVNADEICTGAMGDLNGDGKDDVLLRHEDGRWYYYPMNGREFLADQRGAAFLTSNLDWQFAGIGDLNGDGNDDVLVRRVTDGRWYYYPMDGRRHLVDQRGGMSLISDLAWQFAGTGDLNGDGNDDVLLRHRDDGRWLYYPMDGRQHITGRRGLANIPRDMVWQLAGIGDLNGDGNDDVLLRHTNGTWQYFPMDGRDYLRDQRGAAFLTSNLEWQFTGIGDLNGDGKDDVLVRRVTTGRWYYYPMDGRRHLVDQRGGANIVSDLAWQFAGIGDLNGDGRDDVLLRHRDDGRWLYYPMDGRVHIADQRGIANITRDQAWLAICAPSEPPTQTGRPDLVVESPSSSDSTVTSGQAFTFRATVRNRGSSASNSTTLRYYRSSNSTIDSSDTQIGTDPVSSLSASTSAPESVTLTAPSTTGIWYYGACVDAVSNESNTGNNCSRGVQVTVEANTGTGTPDLVVESLSVSNATLTSGETFTLSATVNNRGSGRSGSTTLRYYRSGDSNVSANDTQVGTDSVSGLSASDSSPESVSLTAPSSAGTYYYGACVDAVSDESNTGNNCSSGVRVTVEADTGTGAPDLVVDALSVSDNTLTTGETFTINATVRNQGSGSAGSTTLYFYRSPDPTIATSDMEVGEDFVSNLSASDSSSEAATLTAPSTPGTYYYGACVDAVSGESNTGNNCSSGVHVTVDDDVRDDHSDTRSGATRLALGGSVSGQIGTGDDIDYFRLQVSESGTLAVYTTGDLDTKGELESSSGALLADNDDGGSGTNFRIERTVASCSYYIRVESFGSNTGSYTLRADFTSSDNNFTLSGFVQDESGVAISGATVTLASADCDYSVITSSDGSFTLLFATDLVPQGAALTVHKDGYAPAALPLDFSNRNELDAGIIILEELGPKLVVLELVPELHHLGDDNFGGSINSGFQRASEGTVFRRNFSLSTAQANASSVNISLLAKGLQLDNRLEINGQLVGFLNSSPSDGSYGTVTFSIPIGVLQRGENTLVIESFQRSFDGDYDDFEFTNVVLRFEL